MKRVAALFLPNWPIDRLQQAERRAGPPEPRLPASLAALHEAAAAEQQHACSVPRGGGWRPGARWAREGELGMVTPLPAHRQAARHEVGRREEAVRHPFRAMRPDEGAPPRPGERGGPCLPDKGRIPSNPGIAKWQDPATRSPAAPPPNIVAPRITALRDGNRMVIGAACPHALALGLIPGMPIAQARAQTGNLDIRPADSEGDRAALRRLAVLAARRWSPLVGVEGADTLFLDLTGTAHLFGGEAAMARRILRILARAGFSARIAIADTPGAAWAIVHHLGNANCPPGRHADTIAALPVRALRIEGRAAELLARFGIETIAQLAKIPRAPLVRRFGKPLALRLDQAMGHIAEPLDPIVQPEAIAVIQRFAEPIATPEVIAHWLAQLVDRLVVVLAQAGLGARGIELVAERVDGVPQRIRLGLARASRNPAHLLKLMVRRIEEVEPGYGLDTLTLHLRRAEPLGAEPFVERLDEEAAPDLAPLVDTLATRIGHDALWRHRPVESDVPERSVTRMPVLDPPARATPALKPGDVRLLDRNAPLPPWHPVWPKPARLLHRPERLDHVMAELPDHAPRRFTWRGQQHQVVCADGPERIHGEWWRRGAERHSVRDYFRVEDEQGRRYWLFRRGDGENGETGDLSWYLHGVFG